MAAQDLISISFDHAQERRQFDRLPAFVAGVELADAILWDSIFVDRETHTLMLRPAPLFDAWWTTHTGTYAKLTGASLEYLTSGNWKAVDVLASGEANYYLCDVAGEWMRTSSALAKNRGVLLSFHNYTAGDRFASVQCGWGSSASTSTGVALEIGSNGDLTVYKGGTVVHTGRVSIDANKLNSLILLPARRRELLIINADTADVARVVFEDISEDASNPTITPAEKFWVKNPSGSMVAQICPVKFPTSGYATSVATSFSDAPQVADTLETFDNETWAGGSGVTYRLWGNSAYQGTTGASASLRKDDGTAFAADGSLQICRLRCTLTGDGEYTPFVEAVEMAYAPVFDTTDDSEQVDNVEELTHLIELTVPEEGPAEWELSFFDPTNKGIVNLIGMSNRPVKISLGGVVLTDGHGTPGRRVFEVNEAGTNMAYSVRDATVRLQTYVFPERKSLRGYTLDQALTFIMSQVLPSTDLDIETSTYVLGDASPADAGDQSPMIEEGDLAEDWIRRLHERTDREWGLVPSSGGLKWISKREATLNAVTHLKLYRSIQDAIDDGVDADIAPYRIYGDVTDDQVEPVSNDVRVTGLDARSGRPVQAFKRDEPASDVTLAPSSRPSNWVGERRRSGVIDDQIATQAECNDMVEELFDQITAYRPPYQVSAHFPVDDDGVPLWRTHRVELEGFGLFAVRSMSASFELEEDGDTDEHDGPARESTLVLTQIEGP